MNDALLEAEALLAELPDAVSRRSLGERLGEATTALRTSDHQIRRMRALVDMADLTGFGQRAEQSEVLEEMVEEAFSVGDALEEAEDSAALRSATFEYSNTLNRAIAALERSIRDHWRSVASERFQPLLGLGTLLTSMNVADNLGTRLAACGQKAMNAGTAGSAADLHDAAVTLWAEYDALQAERAAEIGDDEVGEFINALADKRATLAMVTPKVQAWLADHAALERLGVTTR